MASSDYYFGLASYCDTHVSELDSYIEKYRNFNKVLQNSKAILEKVNLELNDAKTKFDNGAYVDGREDSFSKRIKDCYDTVEESIDILRSVISAAADLNNDLTRNRVICKGKYNDWCAKGQAAHRREMEEAKNAITAGYNTDG